MKEAGNRAADRQALDGGHVKLVYGERGHTEQPPLPDAQATYPKRKERDTPKKERCEANPHGHTHEWMKDEEEIPVIETQWHDVKRTRWLFEEQRWEKFVSREMREVPVGTKPRAFKMCVHCGKTLVKVRGWHKHNRWKEPVPGEHFTKYTAWNGRKVIR